MQRFLALAGGPESLIVFVPTAGERDTYDAANAGLVFLDQAGAKNLVVLHTRDRAVADSEAFVEPLKRARAVWFAGGRQWRLVDSYLDTRTEREFRAVLERGGVIGGTSAGATIQGSYLVRGAREGNTLMMAPGYEKGFGYLHNVAVDQHLLKRKREKDLLQVIDRFPKLLGIGIDEATAIVVEGDAFEVVGESKVGIYDPSAEPGPGGERHYFLEPGVRFDLKTRRPVSR
jgi:cyanophycinase